jgi:hypothetical protein
VAYVGNLTCRDCGLTFTARWGSLTDADEYRCDNDHVVFVDPSTGVLLGLPSGRRPGATLADVFGRCPLCETDLESGRLPRCPVCSGRDHDVVVGGVVG